MGDFLSFMNWNAIAPTPVVSGAPVALPTGAQHFWGLMRTSGYVGPALRAYRLSDGAVQDIGWNPDQLLDTDHLMRFATQNSATDTVLEQTRYDQVATGAVHMTQATPSLMPYLVKNGVLVTDANGLPMPEAAVEGRYLSATNAAPGTQDYSFTAVACNFNKAYFTAADSGVLNPILGVGKTSNTQRISFGFGARSTAQSREFLCELASVSAAQNEIAGYTGAIALKSTCLVTLNLQSADLTNGPLNGTTLFFNRSICETQNHASHSPAALTTVSDVRLGANFRTTWTTETGSDVGIFLAYMGTAMTHAQRQDLEKQIYDKLAAVIGKSLPAVPKLATQGEAFAFNAINGSNQVVGLNGKTNLQLTTAGQGANWAISSAANTGLTGLQSTGLSTFANNFRATNNFGWDQKMFTVAAFITPNNAANAAQIFDFVCLATGSLNTANTSVEPAWLVGRDHTDFCAWTQDLNTLWELFDLSIYVGSDIGTIKAPPKDSFNPAGDHVYFYTQKKHCLPGQTVDKKQVPYFAATTYMVLLKHKPHPQFAGNPNVYKYQATAEFKIAQVGSLNGFGNLPGSWVKHIGNASTAQPTSDMSLCSDAGHQLNTFDGWRHGIVFLGGKYTSDAEDQALFYNGLNFTNLL